MNLHRMKLKSTLSSATRVFLAVAMAVILLPLQAQNLVPNPSFENVTEDWQTEDKNWKIGVEDPDNPNSEILGTNPKFAKEFKYEGMILTHSTDWFGATTVAPDLYFNTGTCCDIEKASARPAKASAPCNKHGYQEVADGDFYAGFRAFVKSNTKLKRSYLEIELLEELEENQMYCVSFDVSLSDLSKYAVNNIGALLTEQKVDSRKDGPLNMEPSVYSKNNPIIKDQIGWETICGMYLSAGGEQYLTIGAFGADVNMGTEKLKANYNDPAECPTCLSSQAMQISDAYYFIDNVKVEPIEAISQCKCGAANERNMDLIYSRTVNLPENASAEKRIASASIYYAYLKSSPVGVGSRTVEELATILLENPDINISILGHCDDGEAIEGEGNRRYFMLGKQRAEEVRDLLVEQGISANRLSVVDKGNSDPASTKASEISMAKNRRVEFKIN